jgi:hypothetical protein
VGGTRSTHGEGRAVYRVLIGRPKGRRPREKPRRRELDSDGSG